MPLHLIKLCVGIDSVADLRAWRAHRAAQGHRSVAPTRQTPKRAAELLDGGSLYWVIKGVIRVRQALVAVEPGTMDDGTSCATLALDLDLVRTLPKPMRPFQGWRYLAPGDAPGDLGEAGGDVARMPAAMVAELRNLCLL